MATSNRSVLDIRAANEVDFRVILEPGEPDDDRDMATVTFYDRRYVRGFGPDGQHICRYYLETLLEPDDRRGGLDLHGGVPDWTIDGPTWALVMSWLHNVGQR